VLTRSLIALVMLNGISLVFWGCVGACRWLHEQARRIGHGPTSATLLALLAALVGALLLVLALELITSLAGAVLGRLALAPASASGALAVLVLAGLLVCGTLASHVCARVFDAPHVAAAIVLSAVVYWLAAATLVHDAVAPALAAPWQGAVSWAVLALSGASCALGVLLARRRVPPAAPAPAAGASPAPLEPTVADVAVLIAAHNEERTLDACLDAVSRCVPASNVYLASDGSTDRTVAIAAGRGCNVLDIQPNGGKARALASVIEHFRVRERYAAVLILDADAEPAPDYLEHALPLLRDPEVVAVAGHALTHWHRHWRPRAAMFFVAYRTRLYRLTQALMRYGQTWKHSNVSFIVPGFASMYRCSVLPHIDIDAPGLIIEDFNMTFELHHKRLGKIAYSPKVRCVSHEPLSLRDYVKQVRRWYLGFWQTIRRHGFWPSLFWLSLGTFLVEMVLQSLAFLTVPLLLAWFVLFPAESVTIWLPQLGAAELTWADVAIGVFLTDYSTTALVAVVERKPILLCYGLGFALLRWVDAFLFLYTLPLAFAVKSDGRWESPKRA
jgi:biofilm PGA synthesis N-glycosyltransferase PgaC